MTLTELLLRDNREIVDWLENHVNEYSLIKNEDVQVAIPNVEVGELSTIIGYRTGKCEGCQWHPDVCGICQNNDKD